MTGHDDPSVRKTHWPRSLQRLKSRSRKGKSRKISRRALLVAFGAIVALVGSALVIGSAEGWWTSSKDWTEYDSHRVIAMRPVVWRPEFRRPEFRRPEFREWYRDRPVSDLLVVARGNWAGKDWFVGVYRSASHKVCFGRGFGPPPATMPHGVRGFPLECRQIIRLEYDANRRIENVQTFIDGFIESGEIFPPNPVQYPKFVPWEFGLVVDEARQVVIRLEDGRRVEASAVPLPATLGVPMRFFVVRLPSADVSIIEARSASGVLVVQSKHEPDGPSITYPPAGLTGRSP
jgi:hypothetical protein